MWRTDPTYATCLAEWLCDEGVLKEADAIRGVLVAAAEDSRVPLGILAAAATELLLPLLRQPPPELTAAINRRAAGKDGERALARLTAAEAVWSVPEEPIKESSSSIPSSDEYTLSTPPASQAPAGARALVKAMRAALDTTSEPPGGWVTAVQAVANDTVTADVARVLLVEASRLGLGGKALGMLAAMAARAGQADAASQALSDALARMHPQGWMRQWNGGTRLGLFEAALRFRSAELVRLAANDLAGGLASGAIVGQIEPVELSRIVSTIFGNGAVGDAWPDVETYLDVFAPADTAAPEPRCELPHHDPPARALLEWVAGYLGHPVRTLDFGARRVFHEAIAAMPLDAEAPLAGAVRTGGWTEEAALHALATSPQLADGLAAGLVAAIQDAATGPDQICRDLAIEIAQAYGAPVETPGRRDLPTAYRLQLPPLPERSAPELDQHGVPYLDPHDPQQLVAPFDAVLATMAKMAALDASTVIHQAGAIAAANTERWVAGGHRAHSGMLKRRGQLHTYRPWAYMAGRRATGKVLAIPVAGVDGHPRRWRSRPRAVAASSVQALSMRMYCPSDANERWPGWCAMAQCKAPARSHT